MKNLLVDLKQNYKFLKLVLALSGPLTTLWLIYIGICLGEENYVRAFALLAVFMAVEFSTTLMWWECFELSKKLGREK